MSLRDFTVAAGKICLLAALLISASCQIGGSKNLVPGEPPPNFSLHNLENESLSLEDLRGKVVLINFWASWCAPCKQEIPELNRLYNEFAGEEFEVLAIGVNDSPVSLATTASAMGVKFPVLIDRTGSVSRSYGTTGLPETFLIDKRGNLVLVHDQQKGEPVSKIVGPRKWGKSVYVDQIRALLKK